ncbi:hypothetical protein CEF21_15425 [Bacillus sp. FJAT-42376]|uniref:lipopolysaccharide biosynthesis protein n=1 Tax=Bacillus sp. FJAT-42376 TaxID=2014076 RepID=UPI000F5157AA|nr:oligosaccharide flippase family protein [Bacillus sp. FJAT-42376]AZB43584.1 hypothetical protein CEF21_15425 [Bacillus sp. FJAT-42376]
MRIKNSLKNIAVLVVSQLVMTAVGFVSRKIFIDYLGPDYLGLNGFFTNVISMLALVESGIGMSIVYHLYKPMSEGNKEKIIAYIQLYKKAYSFLAVIILVLSLLFLPFLGFILKGEEAIENLTIVYLIFVFKNLIYYFNAHRIALINADQKAYILSTLYFAVQLSTTLLRLVILIYTHNYILYLLVELGMSLAEAVISGLIAEKRYPYIKTKTKLSISEEEKRSLIKNVKALFISNIGTYLVFSTDTILIATFINISILGIYSNYSMIINQIASIVKPIISGASESVGNLIATESSEKQYFTFKVSNFVSFWIFSVSVIFSFHTIEPFINVWLGEGYLLDSAVFILILMDFYMKSMRATITIFKVKAGIFEQDKYMSLVEAAINLAASILLVHLIGLAGIFIGTMLSNILTSFWNIPRLVYKYIFNASLAHYFKSYCLYGMLTILACLITSALSQLLTFKLEENFLSLLIKGTLSLVVPSFIYSLLFCRTKEFLYVKMVGLGALSSISKKLKSRKLDVNL